MVSVHHLHLHLRFAWVCLLYSKRESLNFILPEIHPHDTMQDIQSEIDSIEKYKNDLHQREEDIRRLKVEVMA